METRARGDIFSPVHTTAIIYLHSAASLPARRPENQRGLRFLFFALGLCSFLGFGCRSAHPADSDHSTAMLIEGKAPDEIADVVAEEFRHDGYALVHREKTSLTFEKEGSAMSNFAYGSWLGGMTVWVRVKVSIVPAGEDSSRLECQAWRVTNRGESLEEEVKLRSGPWQKLVEEAVRQLGAQKAGAVKPAE